MVKKIDVLWLLEHTAREMDVACAVKSLARAHYDTDITIRNIYLHANDLMKEYFPSIVIFPFLYRKSDLAIGDFVEAWPSATYFNLAWEQVHYKAHLKMKAPGDEFTKQKVSHHAWGDFYKNYLVENGVPAEHIFVNGNPVYQLYKEPYNKYFKQRTQLAHQNGIDPAKKWVFIPENYKWAFFSDEKLLRSAERGGNLEEHMNMRAFCRESLGHVLRWCNDVGKSGELEIIFRPRPATNSQTMNAFFRENLGVPAAHLHITKAETVREWIMASDVVLSSYSTSLIESAIAGKSIYMLEPVPIPDSLYCDWYDFVSRIHNSVEFEKACLEPQENNNHKLQIWAQDKMLSYGDPIERLAKFIAELDRDVDASFKGRKDSSIYNKHLPVLISLHLMGNRKIRRLVRHIGYAIHSLLSACKIIVLHLLSLIISMKEEQEVRSKGTVSRRVLDRLNRALHLFIQGFRDENYYNPATHENDKFTGAEVQERVEKWNDILVSS